MKHFKEVCEIWSDEVRDCTSCGAHNVRQQENCEWVCETCASWQEGHTVQTFAHMGTSKEVKGHDPVQYRNKLFQPLEDKNIDIMNDELRGQIAAALESPFVTWANIKKMVPPSRKWRNPMLYTLPAVMGFQYTWHSKWAQMIEIVQFTVKKLWGPKAKISNIYTLYQVVAVSKYYTDWIPISLTKGKQRELNRKWLRITKELQWDNIPMDLSRHICQDGLQDDFEEPTPEFPELSEMHEYDELGPNGGGTEEIVYSDAEEEEEEVVPQSPQYTFDQVLELSEEDDLEF